jgi:uncharacterized protein
MSLNLRDARRYALDRLARELPGALCYHTSAHTHNEVVPAAARLAELAGVRGVSLLLLTTAAYYHDVGYIVRRTGHEEAGVELAAAALPAFGYRPAHIRRVAALIRATKVPQRPRSLPAQILADADLDVLGRDDFLERNCALRQELENYGERFSDVAWYARQLAFLQDHRYWTAPARALRDDAKQRNRERLAALLAEARAAESAAGR